MLTPFRGFRDMQGEMERMMAEAFGRVPRTTDRTEWAPAIDVTTENGNLVIHAELPGMKREDVDVSLSHGVLTISGEREEEQEREDKGYLVRERRHGSFRRSMTLPEGVDESQIKASFKDGVLEVKVEGAAPAVETQPKRIQIEG
jgi:HSP20 family protein